MAPVSVGVVERSGVAVWEARPTEYRSITDWAVLSSDTLAVSGAQRASLFAPNGEFARRLESQSVVVFRGV